MSVTLPILLCFLPQSLAGGQEKAPIWLRAGSTSGIPTPNTELPAHIQKRISGEIDLIADEKAKLLIKCIPVYLINSGPRPIQFPHQDGDHYLKLETLDDKGKWVRAQPHFYSWCGNSYGSTEL